MDDAGVRPADLSRKTGVSKGYLSSLLSGDKTEPSAKVCLKLAQELGVTCRWLMTGDNAPLMPAPKAAVPSLFLNAIVIARNGVLAAEASLATAQSMMKETNPVSVRIAAANDVLCTVNRLIGCMTDAITSAISDVRFRFELDQIAKH